MERHSQQSVQWLAAEVCEHTQSSCSASIQLEEAVKVLNHVLGGEISCTGMKNTLLGLTIPQQMALTLRSFGNTNITELQNAPDPHRLRMAGQQETLPWSKLYQDSLKKYTTQTLWIAKLFANL